MAVARLRKLLVALLIAAQPASAAFAASATVIFEPCPVHAALVPAETHEAADHAGHDRNGHVSGGHETHAMHGAPADDALLQQENAPLDFSFVCCTAHMAGVLTQSFPDFHDAWPNATVLMNEPSLDAGDLASVDPPPRILL